MTKSRSFGKVQQREPIHWWGSPTKVMGSEGGVEIKGDVCTLKYGLSIVGTDQALRMARVGYSWLESGHLGLHSTMQGTLLGALGLNPQPLQPQPNSFSIK